MQTLFSSLDEIERFTQSICSRSCACPHCQHCDQWVSHGYVYSQDGEVTGKRLVCGQRFGKNGCGRTQQLYLSNVLPHRWYRLSVLIAFLNHLIHGMTVRQAYHEALGHTLYEPRQAWRWLTALWNRMPRLRSCSYKPPSTQKLYRSRRLSLLLNTLATWFSASPPSLQALTQECFC